MKKIGIYGVGAVGGLCAARLAQAGYAVAACARGETLKKLQTQGIGLKDKESGQISYFPVQASNDPAELGVQDVVIIAVKATGLHDIASKIAPMIGPNTLILSAMNGVPWWFFEMPDVALHGTRLRALDADGAIAKALPWQQVIGCVVHLSSFCPEPGVVQVAMGNRLIIGEPVGGASDRVAQLAQVLSSAGFEVEQSAEIRHQVWYKLWGNMTTNPISALTAATADKMLDDALVRQFSLDVMAEAAIIGARIGCPIAQSGEDRMVITRSLGALRTSMLQDMEAGKALEIDALIGVVHEIGQLLDIKTPNIAALFGLARLFGRMHGLYPQA
ncbi:MAG: 2-dehydropantoate 2-reductase [Burkholderiales bacterium]|nr:2-dehydropantoate 2-reductase [Burkholderiales bacterium]